MIRRLASVTLLFALATAGTASAQVGGNQGLLNPNLASEADLAALPQLGADGAAKVLAGRPWLSMAALHAAVGANLDEDGYTELYRHLWLPLNLNNVTEAEILLIPGVGNRMAHEFEEYRPYVGMPEFRREIGKYVDDAEVARLEQFVFVPLDLNSASSEDFATIPGVGPRMIHEFEEYRPYVAMAQFEREMGKYVDDAEVARLARYMIIGE